MPDPTSAEPSRPRPPDAAESAPPRPVVARRRARRRMSAVVGILLVAWVVQVAGMGWATGYWGERGEGHPRGLMAMVTLVALTAIVVAYRRVSSPVVELLGAAEHVAAGDYEVGVTVRGPRELRRLTATFNEMAARLAVSEQQRRRFLADITHELRNPLAVLQSEIEAQMDGVHPRDDHHVASLLEETRRLGLLVDDLHTLALAETGRLVLDRQAVALQVLVDDAVARYEPQARRRDVALRSSVAPMLPEVWADAARIRQVLDNLLANAVRHAPAGGEVVVTASALVEHGSAGSPTVHCRVTDTGPGFPEDQMSEVFDRFVRAGDSRGSGLGLSIARDLVRAHGGAIEATNDPGRGGAAVTFSLPACGDADRAPADT